MLKRIASVLLTVFTANLMAAEAAAPRPPEDGVWVGTLGAQAVMACFDHHKDATEADVPVDASYFYERHGKLIKLAPQPQTPGRWLEVGEKMSTGAWEFRVTAGDLLEGQWSGLGSASTARIRLKRFKTLGSSDPSNGCQTFLALGNPLDGEKIQVSAKTLPNGRQYRVLSVLDGAISTLELVGEGAGLAALNERLTNELRLGAASYFDCPVSGEVPTPASGKTTKPDYSSSMALLFWNERWVSLAQNSNGYCGGAHPFSDTNRSTWALSTGAPVNLWTWIAASRKPDAFPKYDAYYVNYAAPEELNRLIVAKAVKARLAFNPKEAQEQPNCLDALTTNTDYEITLGATGLVFSHRFYHAAQACDDNIEIAYSQLLPFLSAEGKKQVALLMASARK